MGKRKVKPISKTPTLAETKEELLKNLHENINRVIIPHLLRLPVLGQAGAASGGIVDPVGVAIGAPLDPEEARKEQVLQAFQALIDDVDKEGVSQEEAKAAVIDNVKDAAPDTPEVADLKAQIAPGVGKSVAPASTAAPKVKSSNPDDDVILPIINDVCKAVLSLRQRKAAKDKHKEDEEESAIVMKAEKLKAKRAGVRRGSIDEALLDMKAMIETRDKKEWFGFGYDNFFRHDVSIVEAAAQGIETMFTMLFIVLIILVPVFGLVRYIQYVVELTEENEAFDDFLPGINATDYTAADTALLEGQTLLRYNLKNVAALESAVTMYTIGEIGIFSFMGLWIGYPMFENVMISSVYPIFCIVMIGLFEYGWVQSFNPTLLAVMTILLCFIPLFMAAFTFVKTSESRSAEKAAIKSLARRLNNDQGDEGDVIPMKTRKELFQLCVTIATPVSFVLLVVLLYVLGIFALFAVIDHPAWAVFVTMIAQLVKVIGNKAFLSILKKLGLGAAPWYIDFMLFFCESDLLSFTIIPQQAHTCFSFLLS